MAWKMHQREFDSVLKLDVNSRYKYFIKRVADWKEVWGVKAGDGWVMVGDSEGHEAMPVWPHARFADAYAEKNGGGKAEMIDLDTWRDRWISGLTRDGRLVAVFPTPDNQGVLLIASIVQNDIDQELSTLE